jgi:hypothetical protein
MSAVALVALDSNVVDLVEKACLSSKHIDAMEAMEPPPHLGDMHAGEEPEVFASYWLLALAPAWRSTVYTFSELLYEEVSRAARAGYLLRIAFDVLLREEQEPEHRRPDPTRRPLTTELKFLGVRAGDAVHIADAIGLRCDYFLTNDRQLRNKTSEVEGRWDLRIRRPSEFLTEAVRAGAPWPTWAPWPWESIGRLRAGTQGLGIRP